MNQKESRRLSDYQRIVSYLYEYHHGIKGSNVGFAKIEKRQNRLRVYFHVKTNEQALEYKIYFYSGGSRYNRPCKEVRQRSYDIRCP